MAKAAEQLDVLVLGGHPCAYLAAALLKHKTKLRVVHATIPGEISGDRLVPINPEFFSLHPLLEKQKRKIAATAVYGVRFLADDPNTSSEFKGRSATAFVANLKDVRLAMQQLAKSEDVALVNPKRLEIHRLDERGIEVSLGNAAVRPTALVLAGALPDQQQRILDMPEEWETGVLHRYTWLHVNGTRNLELSGRPLMPMSLDLGGLLRWGWLIPGSKQFQIAVEQPLTSVAEHDPVGLLARWAKVLESHGVLKQPLRINPKDVESLDLPFAGALAHEGVANRTLLIGPAGGFYTACAEDIYPNCWSAIHAADVLKKALREKHLQDAIQPYRQRWRTTLGDYLRGPQQNLRFLLPLVYRNQVMTNRLAEAILTGKSVVR